MSTIEETVHEYLRYCREQRRLDEKTVRAYRNDVNQFYEFIPGQELVPEKGMIKQYINELHTKYKPKTVRRKLASIKAFFYYLENEEIITVSPMRKIRTEFREEFVLPKTIPAEQIEKLLQHMYRKKQESNLTKWQRKILVRDIAVIEMLFATGLRISELCNLEMEKIDLQKGILCIKGKGAKERYLQIGNQAVLELLEEYVATWTVELKNSPYFIVNRYGERYSEQSARLMINKYVETAAVEMHITPHMFRHAFATLLLEEDVDIRYIQKMLGHSSIITTQIYTEVANRKQMEILKTKHPRNKMKIINEKC